LLSFAPSDYLGGIDSYDHEPGGWQEGRPDGRWLAWTRYDRRGALPAEVLPERFYLATDLRKISQIGDYSSRNERNVGVASNRFAAALHDAGQTDTQIMPLTVWRRADGNRAPPPIENPDFVALYCWCDPHVFDLERSSLIEVNFNKYSSALTDDGFEPVSTPKAYAGTWQHLALAVDPSDVILPPMFRISGVGGRRYVSPPFAETIVQQGLKVNLVKLPVDFDREAMIGEAVRRGMLDDFPPEHALGG
jgi:hypothetical protein